MKGPPVLLLLAALACTDGPPQTRAERDGGTVAASLSPADSARAVQRAEPLATAIAQGLAQRLQQRLAAEGAASALDFCSTVALALTDSLARAADPAIDVKRTSTRVRNPLNSPDAAERAALAWFDSVRASTGSIPTHHVQALEGEVRYYRPLVIAPFCTQCHGDPARMDPAVVRALATRYPGDRATGYAEGDFRGLLRVTLPRGDE